MTSADMIGQLSNLINMNRELLYSIRRNRQLLRRIDMNRVPRLSFRSSHHPSAPTCHHLPLPSSSTHSRHLPYSLSNHSSRFPRPQPVSPPKLLFTTRTAPHRPIHFTPPQPLPKITNASCPLTPPSRFPPPLSPLTILTTPAAATPTTSASFHQSHHLLGGT